MSIRLSVVRKEKDLKVTYTLQGDDLVNMTVGLFAFYAQFIDPQVLWKAIEDEQESQKRISILRKL